MMMEKDCKEKRYAPPLELEALPYDPNSQNVKLVAGAPLIARNNCKELGIFNNELYDIKEIRHKLKTAIVKEAGCKLKPVVVKIGQKVKKQTVAVRDDGTQIPF